MHSKKFSIVTQINLNIFGINFVEKIRESRWRCIIRSAIARSTRKIAKSNYASYTFFYRNDERNGWRQQERCHFRRTSLRPRRIALALPSGYVTERSKIASAGWDGMGERTLSGQSGTRGTRRRDKRPTAVGRGGCRRGASLSRKYSDGDRFS